MSAHVLNWQHSGAAGGYEMATVTRKNAGALAQHVKALEELDGYAIKAGWDKSAVYENGMPVAQIMAGNEFGVASRSIPARPTGRPARANNKPKWDRMLMEGSKDVLAGRTSAADVMDKIGTEMENDWVAAIVALMSPALSPITIMLRKWKKQGRTITGKVVGEAAAKVYKNGKNGFASYDESFAGVSTKPLIDSGIAVDTLTHIVEKQ